VAANPFRDPYIKTLSRISRIFQKCTHILFQKCTHIHYYNIAIELGIVKANLHLAKCYLYCVGVQRDVVRACVFYRNAQAISHLERLCQSDDRHVVIPAKICLGLHQENLADIEKAKQIDMQVYTETILALLPRLTTLGEKIRLLAQIACAEDVKQSKKVRQACQQYVEATHELYASYQSPSTFYQILFRSIVDTNLLFTAIMDISSDQYYPREVRLHVLAAVYPNVSRENKTKIIARLKEMEVLEPQNFINKIKKSTKVAETVTPKESATPGEFATPDAVPIATPMNAASLSTPVGSSSTYRNVFAEVGKVNQNTNTNAANSSSTNHDTLTPAAASSTPTVSSASSSSSSSSSSASFVSLPSASSSSPARKQSLNQSNALNPTTIASIHTLVGQAVIDLQARPQLSRENIIQALQAFMEPEENDEDLDDFSARERKMLILNGNKLKFYDKHPLKMSQALKPGQEAQARECINKCLVTQIEMLKREKEVLAEMTSNPEPTGAVEQNRVELATI